MNNQHQHSGLTVFILNATIVACIVCFLTVLFVFVNEDDTITQSAASIAITAVIAVMPWQLASLQEERKSHQFLLLVGSGINMSYGALCFAAATVLKYGMIKYAEEQKNKDIIYNLLYMGSSLFIIIAAVFTCIGFYKFVEHLAHHCHCESEGKTNEVETDGAKSNPN